MIQKRASEVGFLHNLNSIITMEGELDHTVESEHLRDLDTCSAPILRKIIDFGVNNLSTKEKEDWCNFIIALFFRHPYMMNEARVDIKRSIQEFDHLIDNALTETYEYKNFRDNYHVENLKNFTLKQNSAFKLLLLGLNWFTLDFHSSSFDLLTGDMPVSVYSLNGKNILTFDDINDSSIYVTFPLAPKKCFLATKSEKNLDHFIFPRTTLIKELNLKLVEKSVFYVFANTNKASRFINKHFKDASELINDWQESLKR